MQPSPSCRNTSVVRSRPSGRAGDGAHPQAAVAKIDERICRHPVDVSGGRRREKAPIAAGSTVRNSSGASSMPPTTTMASGRCTCDPMAVEKAAGNRPAQAATQVISTGPHLQLTGLAQGGGAVHASFDQPVEQLTSMMPFMAAMPNSATKPMAAEMLNDMLQSHSPIMPPTKASGMAPAASSVSTSEPKLR